MPDVKFANTLLQSFDSELIARLHLKSVTFKVGQEIEFPGKPIKHLFFLEARDGVDDDDLQEWQGG